MRLFITCFCAALLTTSLISLSLPSLANDNGHTLLPQIQTASTQNQTNDIPATELTEVGTIVSVFGLPQETLLGGRISAAAPGSIGVLTELGAIKPRRSNRLIVLSTGLAGSNQPLPGTDFGGASGDHSEVTLELHPPRPGTVLEFSYNFLTTEYARINDSRYGDHFSISLAETGHERVLASNAADNFNLIPTTRSSAAGSGYELYSSNPMQMDSNPDVEMPMAALTGWQTVRVPLTTDDTISLTFSINDTVDDLYDSSLLISGLKVDGISLTAADPLNIQRGSTGSTLDCIFQAGIVEGAVADGLTSINFSIFGLPGPGLAQYTLPTGMAPEDGGFDFPGGNQRLNVITVPVSFVNGTWSATAQYLTPEEFNRGGDEALAERIVNLRVDYFPSDPTLPPLAGVAPFRILRPAVVLMHGLWSSAVAAWGNSPLRQDSRLRVFIGDYSSTNAASFSINTERPARPIREACEQLRADGIAMTQVDYVGHSMGGIIGRNFETLQPNLINKFFTFNTPHTGSPVANAVVFIRNNLSPIFRPFALAILRKIGFPIDQGALDDLSLGSLAINNIETTPIPSHALVGVGGSDVIGDNLASLPGSFGAFFSTLRFYGNLIGLFDGLQHDYIVGRSSQEGGIAVSAITIFNGEESTHTRATSNPEYTNRVLDLLNTDAVSSEFGNFPSPSQLAPSRTLLQDNTALPLARNFIPNGIVITAPADGTVLEPGSAVTISVEAQNGFALQTALVVSTEFGMNLDGPVFSGTITLPDDIVGQIEIIAQGLDAQGNLTEAESINLQVTTSATLVGIEIINRDPVFFDADDLRQMYVMGTFNDGVSRDITSSSTGTQYAIADTSIASITADGLITPLREGVTALVVQNNGIQDSVTVTVNAGQIVLADSFEQ